MRRTLTLVLTVCLGVGLLGLGVVVGLASPSPTATDAPAWLSALVGLLVVLLAAWKLLRRPSDERAAPAPWTEAGSLVETRPEATPETDRIPGTAFTEQIEAAATAARREETVEAGLAAVREPLRETLVATLEQGGWDGDRIDAALADGSWTDDPVAAAAVDDRVAPPVRPPRRRVWAWLFPEQAVRHRVALTVGAIATAADTVLPPVVGQRAPRPVPIVEPTVDDLRRAADGSLRRAVEGRAAVRSPGTENGDGSTGDADWATGDGESAWGQQAEQSADTSAEVETDEPNSTSVGTTEPSDDDTADGEWRFAGGSN